ncbi:BTB/POZ and MATH domain-containing protein 2-like [Panicum virgatum]|uniref:BTB/POZ and MATH domain-containing protein 2-like n=1 Tax=Panicum virgatum TaxID=38727 RepID=UPI0019D59050|nr:BTB/POZ and MATH domain-containing protein 2-like [Panicum virgatum]
MVAEAAKKKMPQKTASTHRSAFLRGVHEFDIVGYSVRTALGVSNSVRSGAFEAGGHTWALVCCFEPRKLESICLELLSTCIPSRDVVAMASLRIDDPTGAGRWPAAVWRCHEAHTFPASSSASSSSNRTWKLSLPDAFNEARHVHDDRLTVHCTVDALEEHDGAPAKTRRCFVSAPPPPSISQDLHRLLETEDSRWPPDVFVVEGAEIQAHKLVLSVC